MGDVSAVKLAKEISADDFDSNTPANQVTAQSEKKVLPKKSNMKWRPIAKLLKPRWREELKKKNITNLMAPSTLMVKELHTKEKRLLELIIVLCINLKRTKKLRNTMLSLSKRWDQTMVREFKKPRWVKTMRKILKKLKIELKNLRLPKSKQTSMKKPEKLTPLTV